jgi:hypothetical protein
VFANERSWCVFFSSAFLAGRGFRVLLHWVSSSPKYDLSQFRHRPRGRSKSVRSTSSPVVQAAPQPSATQPASETLLYNSETNYGNPERPPGEKATYSRFRMSIPIKHAGSELIYLKTFIGVFISVAIAFLTFLVDPTDLDPRFGVGVAGIFGAVSSMIVVSSNLPENPYFTLSDKVHLISLGFIFLSILVSCIVLKVSKNGFALIARRIDLGAGTGLLALYILTIFILSI